MIHIFAIFKNEVSKSGFSIPLPTLEEQKRIAEFLDCTVSKLEILRDEAKVAISLLNEHRSALISAAVTGKIDVRGYAQKEAA